MNKKIILSLSVIGIVAAIAVGGTIAYFSDTETSVGNTFTAGTIDISLNSKGGQAVQTVSGDLDLKPSQTGWTKAVVTNVGTNPAEIWKHIGNVENREHGIVEPEQEYYDEHDGSENWKISNWIHYDMLVCKSGETSYVVEEASSWSPTPVYNLSENGFCGINHPVTFNVIDNCEEVTFEICTPDGFTTQQCCEPYGSLDDTASFAFDVDDDGGTGWNGYDFQVMYEPGSGQQGWPSGEDFAYADIDDGWHDDHYSLDTIEGVSADKTDTCLIVTISKDKLGGLGSSYGFWSQLNDHTGLHGCEGGPDQLVVTPGEEDGITVGNIVKEILESEDWFLTGEDGVKSHWIYLGILEPEESMFVKQSYHLDGSVGNWGQSDRVFFDVDFMAQQTEGTPPPPEPDPTLHGHGRPEA